MQITLDIPEIFAAQLAVEGQAMQTQFVRDAAIGAYCRDAISRHELQLTLELSHYELDAMLKKLGVEHGSYSGQDLLDDLETLGYPGLEQTTR